MKNMKMIGVLGLLLGLAALPAKATISISSGSVLPLFVSSGPATGQKLVLKAATLCNDATVAACYNFLSASATTYMLCAGANACASTPAAGGNYYGSAKSSNAGFYGDDIVLSTASTNSFSVDTATPNAHLGLIMDWAYTTY